MKKSIKKFLGLMLTVLMILSVVPISVSAAELKGSGTEEDPYIIASASDAEIFSDQVKDGKDFAGKKVSLTENIELGDSYIPIGTKENPFSGIFEGNGHKITANLKCDYAGIFSTIKNAVIKDVDVDGSFSATSYAGAIAACAENSKISDCKVLAKVYATNYVGGIVGFAQLGEISDCVIEKDAVVGGYENYCGGIAGNTSADIKDCVNKAYVYGKNNVGGIAGCSLASIDNCQNFAFVKSTGENCGGIAGFSEGKISFCRNTKNINGNSKIGGILGVGYNATVDNSMFSGNLSAEDDFSAGIAAYLTGGSIEKCLFSGSVSGSNFSGGIFANISESVITECFACETVDSFTNTGIIGSLNDGEVSSCYYPECSKSAFAVGKKEGATALSAEEIHKNASYNNWDFENTWVLNQAHSKYPIMKYWKYHNLDEIESVAPTCTEDGYKTFICRTCNEQITEILPATGHDFELITSKEATCTENGYKDYKCSLCGETKTEEIKALGHKDENNDNVCDVCGQKINSENPETPEEDNNIFQIITNFFQNLFNVITEFVKLIKNAIENLK